MHNNYLRRERENEVNSNDDEVKGDPGCHVPPLTTMSFSDVERLWDTKPICVGFYCMWVHLIFYEYLRVCH